jgi:four helix bundle protein
MSVRSYEELRVWIAAMDLVDSVYRESRRLPIEERYGLLMQMRRASVSVAANIAEGHSRQHRGDFLRHLSFAAGSLAELETQLRVATRQGFIPDESLVSLLDTAGQVGRMLRRMRRSLGGPH